MDANQIAVDFQTDNDVVRLHLTLFDDESDEDNRDYHDSDEDARSEREDLSSGVRYDEDQYDSDDDYHRPAKKIKPSSSKKICDKKKSCIRIRGGLGEAAKSITVIDTWHNLITPAMIDQLVVSTNHFIAKVRSEFTRERDAAPTDNVEIKAFIGLLYLVGIHRGSRLSLKDFWDSSGIGIEMFRLTMTNRRFRFLMRCLRFDERCIDADIKEHDPLEDVDQIFSQFIGNCQSSYSLGTAVSLDLLKPTQQMPSPYSEQMDYQPGKCGINILAVVDSKIMYTHNMKISGVNEVEELFSSNDTSNMKKIIGDLCGQLKESGVHSINVDKRFAKFELIFEEMVRPARTKGSSSKNVTFYEPKTTEVPPINTLIRTYDVSITTKRWTVMIFFQMLNVAGINSQIIYTGNGNLVKNRRTFLRQLAIDLTQEHMARRGATATSNSLPSTLHARLLEVTNQIMVTLPPAAETTKRKLCQACLREDKSRKSTKYRCAKCGMYLCLGHVIVMCGGCYASANCAMNENKLLNNVQE